uniref:C-type lectin domain-containing protein n=1 Tax=Syphacia muris TaxID=451379 RepID=A0A0N5A8D9_9BILA
MRSSYGIMLYGSLAGCGCGIVMAANGVLRLISYHNNHYTQRVPSTTCILESIGPWEAWINFQFASCLFAHSIDRLIVVCYPLSYFANQSKIVAALVVFSFIPATLAVAVLIIREIKLPVRIIDRACINFSSGDVFETPAITYIDLAKLIVGGISIILIVPVLVVLRRVGQFYRRREKMTSFRKISAEIESNVKNGYNKKQESFTKIAFSANVCNVVLFVIPGIVMYIVDKNGSSLTDEVRVGVKMLYLLNTLNIAGSSILFHYEIRSIVFPRRRHTAGVSIAGKPLTYIKPKVTAYYVLPVAKDEMTVAYQYDQKLDRVRMRRTVRPMEWPLLLQGYSFNAENCHTRIAKGANLPFSQADFFCKSIKASIVQVDSESENSFLCKIGDRFTSYWIKANISIESNKNNSTAYSNWAFTQPDKCCGENVDCIQMDSITGLWEDTSCNETAHVICEAPLTQKTSSKHDLLQKIKKIPGFGKLKQLIKFFSITKDNNARNTHTLRLPMNRRLVVGPMLFMHWQ